MKKLLLFLSILLIFGCSSDNLSTSDLEATQALEAKPEKAKKAVVLTPTVENTNPVGRIMLEPENYTDALPLDDNGGFTDWDGDGLEDDLVVINHSCYFPKSVGWVSVFIDGTDEVIVSYAVRWSTQLVGFSDVDNDGDMDLILRYAKYYPYNHVGSYTASEYHVGLNEEGQYPLKPGVILESLAVQDLPNGNGPIDVVKWDLSGYGLTNYPVHVFFGVVGTWVQTSTYGEWGVSGSYFERNAQNRIRFSNELEGCENAEAFFDL